MCVAYSRPKNLGNIFTYSKLTVSMGPQSPPIWSRDWGPYLFFNQYVREKERDEREREWRERVERESEKEREVEIERERERE